MLVEGPRLSVVACRGPSTNIAGHQMKKRNPNGAFSAPKSLHVALTDESDDDGRLLAPEGLRRPGELSGKHRHGRHFLTRGDLSQRQAVRGGEEGGRDAA